MDQIPSFDSQVYHNHKHKYRIKAHVENNMSATFIPVLDSESGNLRITQIKANALSRNARRHLIPKVQISPVIVRKNA